MKVSREDKKLEAIKRMKALKLFAPCIREFKNNDEVQLTEPFGGLYEFSSNEELNRYVEDFETEYNALVYHVIICYTFQTIKTSGKWTTKILAKDMLWHM